MFIVTLIQRPHRCMYNRVYEDIDIYIYIYIYIYSIFETQQAKYYLFVPGCWKPGQPTPYKHDIYLAGR